MKLSHLPALLRTEKGITWAAGAMSCAVVLGLVVANRMKDSPAMPRPSMAAASVPPPTAEPEPNPPQKPAAPSWPLVVKPRLEQAEREAEAAIEARLAGIDEFLAERKPRIPAFAEEVLSTGSKLQFFGHGMSTAVDMIGSLISEAAGGGRIGTPEKNAYDRLADDVRVSFQRHVLSPEQIRAAIDTATKGYLADIEAIEGRLLVDLDIDSDLAAGSLPPMTRPAAMPADYEKLMAPAVKAAHDDIAVALWSGIGSFVASDAVADRITRDGASGVEKFGVNAAAGVAMDQAIGKGLSAAGYDAQTRVSERAVRALEAMRTLLVEGDPKTAENYRSLCQYRDYHSDKSVAGACREAADAMARGGHLGLRDSLWRLWDQRLDARQTAIRHLIPPGVEIKSKHVPKPKVGLVPFHSVSGEKGWMFSFDDIPADRTIFGPLSEDTIRFARQCRDYYGGRQP